MSRDRVIFAGSCAEAQPGNWKNACQRYPGHYGEHRARLDSRTDAIWPKPGGFPVRLGSRLRRRNYVGLAR